MLQITMIGAGNLAWHLAQALDAADCRVVQVYSRKLLNAKALASKLYDAESTDSLDFSESESDLFLLAVRDQAFAEVIPKLQLPENAIIAHTSGTQELAVLKNLSKAHGVFYPLQTFSKARKINFKKIHFCLEASNENTLDFLAEIADSLSKNIYQVSSADRRALHIAAVFACNFTNHLFTISKEILAKNDLEFEMLKPLIEETIEKAMSQAPEQSQTGPAVRGDQQTIEAHLQYLRKNTSFEKVYEALSTSIRKYYHV